MTKAPGNNMRATFQADLKKAKSAAEIIKGAMTAAANKMFTFYANLLSVKAKYAWNKIVKEQTEEDPYVDLQGILQKGPRGMSRQSFEDCVLFHLLTMFPINTAEQESTTSPLYLRSPSLSRYVSLLSSSTPTLRRCHAFTTAPVSMPPPSPRAFCSCRLS